MWFISFNSTGLIKREYRCNSGVVPAAVSSFKGRDKRYNELRAISIEILSEYTGIDQVRVGDIFANETGYQTPKIDVRAAVFADDKILLVQEQHDSKWCMPGGWVDIDTSLKQTTMKEVKEEAGIDCIPKRIISVFDRRLNAAGPVLHTIFTFFIQCEYVSGQFEKNLETVDARFFTWDQIPELSPNKTTHDQILQCFLAKDQSIYEPTFE